MNDPVKRVGFVRILRTILLAPVWCALLFYGVQCKAGPTGFVADRLLLKMKPGVMEEDSQRILAEQGAVQDRVIPHIAVRVLRVPPPRLPSILAALRNNPQVEFAEKDVIFAPDFTPNDPLFSSEWHLQTIAAPAAWDVTLGNPNIVIAILDTGVDGTHPDLGTKLVAGWNTYDNNSNTNDVNGHGTWVAGTAGASANNGIGVASVGFNCMLMPIRVSDTSGLGYASSIASGLTWAADHGARVANVSYEVTGVSTVSSAAQYFDSKGGVVTVSAGNESSVLTIPHDPNVLTVSATDSTDAIASFSNTGTPIDLAAPGVSIYTTTVGGGYGTATGTSFSAPVVAGVAALVLSVNPGLSGSQLQQVLEQSADDLGAPGWDPVYGYGRVNAQKAVNMALNYGRPLSGTNQIWGRVLWAGQPVSGALVSATNSAGVYQTWTISDGSYILSNLPPAMVYNLGATESGLVFTPQFPDPLSLGSSNFFGADLYANQSALNFYSVSGRVTDPVNGVAGAEVRGGGMVTTTDASGNYQFTNFLNGSYNLVPSKDSWIFSPSNQTITISSASSSGNNFARFAPHSISGSIYGVPATSASPAPLVYLSNGRSVSATRAGTGQNRYWNYSLSNVPAGTYSITTELPGYGIVPGNFSNPLTISASLSGMNFTGSVAAVAGSLSGRITQEDVPLSNVAVQATLSGSAVASATTDSDGCYRIPNLAGGSYVLVPGLAGYSFAPLTLTVPGVPASGNDFTAAGSFLPPVINTAAANPSTVSTVSAGSTLSVSVTGQSPLIYKWDALNASAPVTFSVNDAAGAASTAVSFRAPGGYTFRLRVTDSNGLSATTNIAVTVSGAPGSMVVAPYQVQLNPGQAVAFHADAWDQVGNPISVSPSWSAAGGGTIDSTGLFTATAPGGPFAISATAGALVATGFVWVTSSQTTLFPPEITAEPTSAIVDSGSNASFNVVATGTAPLNYQWFLNGIPIAGATSSTFTQANVQLANAGDYSVQVTNLAGVAQSSNAVLTVISPPTVADQPSSQTVIVGTNVAFAAAATGSNPLTYQWLFNGAPISAATGSSYILMNVQLTNSGAYSVQVSNAAGLVQSTNAWLTVLLPPIITSQPLSQSVAAGSNATFGVTATGSSPLSYQWLFNGAPISGATDTSYTLLNAQVTNAGAYSVLVSNAAATIQSAEAALAVLSPPVITSQPLDVAAAAGSNVTFSVVATGSPPLDYQWLLNDVPIVGATNASYARLNVQSADAGAYSVQVANPAGSSISSNALLTVNNAPVLAPIGNRILHAGASLLFTNQAQDIDSPQQTLTFSLDPGAPAGATIDSITGIFSWNTTPSQAGSTNSVTVRVTDNGVPPLSDSKTFSIVLVAPLTVQSIVVSNATVTILWNAIPQTTYQIQYKQNISDTSWTSFPATVVANDVTASFTDPLGPSQRIYRVLANQ